MLAFFAILGRDWLIVSCCHHHTPAARPSVSCLPPAFSRLQVLCSTLRAPPPPPHTHSYTRTPPPHNDAAMKSGGNALRGARALVVSDITGLMVPFAACVDYLGFRVLATVRRRRCRRQSSSLQLSSSSTSSSLPSSYGLSIWCRRTVPSCRRRHRRRRRGRVVVVVVFVASAAVGLSTSLPSIPRKRSQHSTKPPIHTNTASH